MNNMLNLDDFEICEVESIELLGEKETIDICVKDTHMFYANDIYTHNSGFNNLAADETNIGKAIEVFQVADYVIMYVQDKSMKAIEEAFALLLKNRLGLSKKAQRVKIDNGKSVFTPIGKLLELQDLQELGNVNTQIESINKIRENFGNRR